MTVRLNHAHGRLAGFLALSLILHAGVLGWREAPLPWPEWAPRGPTSVHLEFVAAPRGEAAGQEAVRPPSPAPSRPNSDQKELTRSPEDPVERVSRPTTPSSRPKPSPAIAPALLDDSLPRIAEQAAVITADRRSSSAADLSTRAVEPESGAKSAKAVAEGDRVGGETPEVLMARVAESLAKYFYYPALARRQGWEGAVRVRFDLEADGAISNVSVAQSSGYAILDRSAVKAMRRVPRLTDVSLPGRLAGLELPVHYELKEG